MHSFSSFGTVFSPLFEKTVDSCRDICDQLVLFDGAGQIRAVRTDNPALREAEDFLSLLDDGERAFFLQNCSGFAYDRLVLMTRHGAAMVFCHLFPACGLFVAVISSEEPSLWRQVCESVPAEGLLLSDAIRWACGQCREPVRVTCLSRMLGGAAEALCFHKEKRGVFGDAAEMLAGRACEVARFVGCHLSCRAGAPKAVSDAFVFSMPAYVSLLLLLLIRVRRESPERRAVLEILERDGRIFIELSAECDGAETEMLSFCRAAAERKELPFEVTRVGTRETVTFSPTVCDVSYLGLKNPFVFE